MTAAWRPVPAPVRNILSDLPPAPDQEVFEELVTAPALRIERIVSHGQTTPLDTWYDQQQDEWVLVISGRAELLIEGEAHPRPLASGDHLLIPAGCRHRVTWTDPDHPTIWLAVHFSATQPVPDSGE